MTDLDKQAQEYAEEAMRGHGVAPFERDEMLFAIRQAYKTGWIDCDTPSETPETLDEIFVEAPDCRYFNEGDCGLTEDSLYCVRDCCVTYSPKTGMEMAKEGDTNVPEHRNPFINNPLLDARYTIGGSELKKIDYSVKIPNIEDKTGKNE